MDFLEKIKKLKQRLYPTGRAFKIPFGSVKEDLHAGIAESENRALQDAAAILDGILPDNDNFTADDAADWERRLGLIEKPTVTLEERKAAIFRKMNHPGDIPARQHFLYVEFQLQLAGFDLWVYENRFDNGSGGFFEKQPFQFVGSAVNPQGGLPVQHGQQQHGLNSGLKVANHLEETRDAPFIVSNLRQTFFIGGSTPGVYGDVPEDRKIELRQLLLLLKPAQSIAYLLVYFGDGIFDSLQPGLGSPNINTQLSLFVQGNKCYWVQTVGTRIKVHDVANDVNLAGEEFGLGDLTTPVHITIKGDKAYVSDVGGVEEIKVFNILSGAYLSGENFGSGIIDTPNGVRIVEDKAYVTDEANGEVHVFEVSSSTHLSAEDVGAGVLNTPVDVEVFDGKVYVLDQGDDVIYVFDAATGEHLEAEDITSVQINSPNNFRLINNLFYLSNEGSDEVEVFNRNTRKYLAANSIFVFGVEAIDIRDDDLYALHSVSDTIAHYTKN